MISPPTPLVLLPSLLIKMNGSKWGRIFLIYLRYKVSVKAYIEPEVFKCGRQGKSGAYTCGCSGDTSNILVLQCAGPPSPPRLWIKEISKDCVTLSWTKAQEYGHITVTVYYIYYSRIRTSDAYLDILVKPTTTFIKSYCVIFIEPWSVL